MKQEDKFKQLLLKDLCARLPYGVICDMWSKRNESDKITEVLKCDGLKRLMNSDFNFMVKPYLFPLSSMTDEQRFEYHNYCDVGLTESGDELYYDCAESLDWLNAHHFDYRELIPKGLAKDATNIIFIRNGNENLTPAIESAMVRNDREWS